jgi:hypothetical protein
MAITKVSGGVIADSAVAGNQLASGAVEQYFADTGYNAQFRNRIINGDMRIAQRGTAAVTATTAFPVDRFVINNATDGAYSAQQDTSAPAGFTNSVKITTTTADATLATTQRMIIRQMIEGTNSADLGWGTANAKTVTLSFWVRSSLTGTFGGAINNEDNTRSYPFTYSISVADTWEYKTVTIPGDTSGTWLTTTSTGIRVVWSLGCGPDRSGTAGAWNSNNNNTATGAVAPISTLNATWYITGVQLEVGSVATPFERRPYGTELSLCQRYYQKSYSGSVAPASASTLGMKPICVYYAGVFTWNLGVTFPTEMRAAPTIAVYDGAGNANKVSYKNNAGAFTDNVTDSGTTATTIGTTGFTSACGLATTGSYFIHYTASSEL